MSKQFIYRPIAIPLNDEFKYIHDTHQEGQPHHLFVGRKRIIDKLVSFLQDEDKYRGSYLITGYRGAGKTSVVNKALDKYKKSNKRQSLNVRINLGDNNQLTPLHIYFSIANILREEMHRHFFANSGDSYSLTSLVSAGILSCLFSLFITLSIESSQSNALSIYIGSMVSVSFLKNFSLSFLALYLLFVFLFKEKPKNSESKIFTEIYDLIERMSNQISEATRIGFTDRLLNFSKSRHKTTFPINSREAEDKLCRILEQLKNEEIKVIFILDEIDKLSDNEELSEIYQHNHSNIQENDKIHRINTLLGSLKNFFTTAQATFFFISGRETLDRYYSEKGSPNSLYESLFDQVLEVRSFLTDEGDRPKGTQLTLLIEEYVCRRINKLKFDKNDKCINIFTLREFSEELYEHALGQYRKKRVEANNELVPGKLSGHVRAYKIKKCFEEFNDDKSIIYNYIFFLRSFVHFLTFHSWGNPKRLNTIFESFIVPNESVVGKEKDYEFLEFYRNDKARYSLVFNNSDKRSFALTSEITTLFQHQLSREVSRISDKLTVSVFSSILLFSNYIRMPSHVRRCIECRRLSIFIVLPNSIPLLMIY